MARRGGLALHDHAALDDDMQRFERLARGRREGQQPPVVPRLHLRVGSLTFPGQPRSDRRSGGSSTAELDLRRAPAHVKAALNHAAISQGQVIAAHGEHAFVEGVEDDLARRRLGARAGLSLAGASG